jgi:hypothetical protein
VTSEEAAAVLAGTTAALTAGVEAAGVEAALEGAAGFAGEAAAPAAGVVEAEDEEAAVEPADALVADPFWAESSELQPPRTAMNEMHANPAQTLSAPTLNTIATCSYMLCDARNAGDHVQDQSSRRQRAAAFGNPAICRQQTGSFAPPTCDGFALERWLVNHGKICAALCLCSQTSRPAALICCVN